MESVSVTNGGGMGNRVGVAVASAGVRDGRVYHGSGVGLGEGLANDGLAGSVSGGSVCGNGTVAGVTLSGVSVTGVHSGSGDNGSVTSQLLSEHGSNASGGTVQLSLSGLHSVDCLPRVVYSGVDGLSVEFGGLVVVFAGSISSGADVVGSFNVSVDGGASDVSGRDGGKSGSGVGNGDRSVSHSQGSGVSHGVRSRVGYRETGMTNKAMTVRCCQQTGWRGCGAGEDGGDNLRKKTD